MCPGYVGIHLEAGHMQRMNPKDRDCSSLQPVQRAGLFDDYQLSIVHSLQRILDPRSISIRCWNFEIEFKDR